MNQYALPDGKLPVDVTIRAAGPNGKDRNVDLKIYTDSGSLEHEKTITVDGAGFQNFMDRTWSGIRLDPNKRQLRLFVFFVAGNTNLCSVKIAIASDRDPHPGDDDDDDDDDGTVDKYIPFTVNALEYDDAIELDDAVKGICKIGQPPIDEPDAQVCLQRIKHAWFFRGLDHFSILSNHSLTRFFSFSSSSSSSSFVAQDNIWRCLQTYWRM